MDRHLPILIALLAFLAFGKLASARVRLPVPVFLSIAGFGLSLFPGLRDVRLEPDLILLLFLPPLLYADAFDASWNDFRRWLRPIFMLAVGLVAFTILAVGLAAHAFLPGLPWVACFLLGAVVSPTDTVAVQSVIERLRVPRRLTAIVGGESMVNDATGLVGVQLGVAVALSGSFEWSGVALRFAWVAGGGIAVGLSVGALFAWANRLTRDTPVLFVLSLLSPYLSFFAAHLVGASGVLAVVVAGFLVSWRIQNVPAEARVELYATWHLLTFVLNGMCFLFIGLEAPHVLSAAQRSEGGVLLTAGLALSVVTILARIVWCFPSAYVSLFLSPRLRRREGGYPPVQGVAIVSWCGVRGAVSLAAALALPRELDLALDYPVRDSITACTMVVILVTLLIQGSTLSPLVRLLGDPPADDTHAEVRAAREALLAAGIARLDEFCSERTCPLAVHHYRTLMADELAALNDADEEERTRASLRTQVSKDVRRAVAAAQERRLLDLRDRGAINDRTFIDLQLELDRANLDALGRDGEKG